jgi:uncharacterized damage-inducible protein DinB
LKARLALIRRDLDEALDNIDQDMLPWAPAEGMRTVAGQIVEIVATEMQLVSLLRDDRWIDDADALALIGGDENLERLKEALGKVRQDTLNYLESLPEDELAKEVEFSGGWLGSLGLATVPRAEVFLNIAEHEWYHVGQLTSYLWARGVDPYA